MTALYEILIDTASEIEALLKKANGAASAHTITRADDVAEIAARAEHMLEKTGITKKSRVGTRVTYTPAGPGKAYARQSKSKVVTTTITLVRREKGWRLVYACRAEIWPDRTENLVVSISEQTARDIQRRSIEDFRVVKTAA